MSSHLNIRYLKHSEIDKLKWDQCINDADNCLIYGYSCYLDHMAKHWDALILNNYEAVMPLTWNKKYGISYLYQPFLTAQLGVFGKNSSGELLNSFLNAIPSRFQYWDLYLNFKNRFYLKDYPMYERNNFVLNIEKPYLELYKSYRENIKRNIIKAERAGCRVQRNIDVKIVIDLAARQLKNYSNESPRNLDRLLALYQHLSAQQKAATYAILSATNEIQASCIFFFSNNRAYYILAGNHPDGRKNGASHFLIDAFIKDHAGKKMILDFEGSDVKGLALFYSGFGASEENFSAIKLNRLPRYVKWLKK